MLLDDGVVLFPVYLVVSSAQLLVLYFVRMKQLYCPNKLETLIKIILSLPEFTCKTNRRKPTESIQIWSQDFRKNQEG